MSKTHTLPRTLVLLLAGGEGNRLRELTANRAKPVLPFAGQYRLIDFALSNCAHSGLHDVWVVEQFQTHSINTHLGNGRPWDLDKTWGGLQILPPNQGDPEGGWHEGNADAIWRSAKQIRAFNPELILVLSADAIYRFDYREAIAFHIEKKAEATLVTTHIEGEEATRFGNVRTTAAQRVQEFAYKPETPLGKGGKTEVTCEIFVYNAAVLLEVLDDLAKKTGKPRDEAALSDFGQELLPALVKRGKTWAFPFTGYWRDVGTVESYFEANQQFLNAPPFELDDSRWPILSRFSPFGAAKIAAGALVENTLVSPGCRIEGEVKDSVLGPGVVVERGAKIEDSIVLGSANIRAGVEVRRAIVDEGARVKKNVGGKKIKIVV